MALKVDDQNKSTTKKTTTTKKRRKAAETLIHFVLDETGSMSGVRDATIDGFNEYVNGLRADKKGKYWMSLTKFDSRGIVPVYENLPLSEVPDLDHETYCPCSMTNLNDAIGESMTIMEGVVAKRTKKCNTLIVVMTDGHENASVEWKADRVKRLIQKKEKEGWTVTFLGANMDAQKVGSTYAIKAGNAKTYSTSNMAQTMRGMSNATVMYAATATVGASSDSFFEGTDDWTDGNSGTGDAVDPNLTAAAAPPADLNISNMTVTNAVFNPPSKKTIFDDSLQKSLDEANERFLKSGAEIKPLDDKKEDTDNG